MICTVSLANLEHLAFLLRVHNSFSCTDHLSAFPNRWGHKYILVMGSLLVCELYYITDVNYAHEKRNLFSNSFIVRKKIFSCNSTSV